MRSRSRRTDSRRTVTSMSSPCQPNRSRLREVPGDWRFESLTRALVDAPEVLVTRRGIGQGRLRLVADDREGPMPPPRTGRARPPPPAPATPEDTTEPSA